MTPHTNAITVLGAGIWGTALALLLNKNKQSVCLWEHNASIIDIIQKDGEHSLCLPGIPIPDTIKLTKELPTALDHAQDILICVPSHVFRTMLQRIKPYLNNQARLIWATKGLDPNTNQLLSDVVHEEISSTIPMAVLSGPSFAKEVALGKQTAVNIASQHTEFLRDCVARFNNPQFHVHPIDDMVGAQVGGAIKNIIAIAVGIFDGLQLGANARSALLTNSLSEIKRLGLAMGAMPETFNDLAGIGDLILTCTDNQSRNRRMGLALGQGKAREQAQQEIGQVVEGIHNVKQAHELAQLYQIDMPITDEVYRIIFEGNSIENLAENLL